MLPLIKPIVFFDVETTGLKPDEDRICSLCMVKIMPDGERVEKYTLVNPGRPIPAAVTEIHGITDEMVKDAPRFEQIARGILLFIMGCDLAGFNCNTFDAPFLYYEFNRAKIEWDHGSTNIVDVGNIFKIQEPRTLSAAYYFYCGQELDEAHNAKADVNATIDVFIAQLQKYEIPETIPELALLSAFDKKRIDIAGRLYLDDDGDACFSFGKNKDKKAKSDPSYLDWIINKSDFPADFKQLCIRIKQNTL